MSYSSWKPPFSYSGGKSQLASRIINLLGHHFPNESHLLSPFLGGAAVELRWMHLGGSCLGADVDKHVILLWEHLIRDAGAVADTAYRLMPMEVATWHDWYAELLSSDSQSVELAAKYFLLRYTKVVHAFAPWKKRLIAFNSPKVHWPALARIAQFRAPRLSVEHADFRDFLNNHDGIVYADSPYFSERGEMEAVYEKRGEADSVFTRADHEALADLLCSRSGWIASNHDCDWVRNRYRGYEMHAVSVNYASRSAQQKSNRGDELIIVSP